MSERLLITGGAGFIGANLVHLLANQPQEHELVVVDKLTYAGNRANIARPLDTGRATLRQLDVADVGAMRALFDEIQPTGVIHLAAESHVDRSITGPATFIESNIVGTFSLLEAARTTWVDQGRRGRFLHVSTDEVYGSLGEEGAFTEETPYDPSSPYSASKAASDHLVRAYHRTYGLDVVITNCSNNFGPYQYPEKLIPVIIRNIRDGKPLPVYGDGKNVRDWLYVEDHCEAIWAAYRRGVSGRSYNIGTQNELQNLELVEKLCDLVDAQLGRSGARELITFVDDRPGHDWRYAIDPTRIREELGWRPRHDFDEALAHTVAWYLNAPEELRGTI